VSEHDISTPDEPRDDAAEPAASNPKDITEPPLGSPWEDLRAYVATPRLTGLRLSPDGTRLVASVSTLNKDKNAYVTSLWQVDPSGAQPARRLTRGVDGDAASAFTRGGDLLFTSKRTVPAEDEPAKDSTKALWCLPAGGGEAYVAGRRDGGWEAILTSTDADTVVLAAPAHPGTADEKADAERREARSKAKVSAILHKGVPVRFWDHDLGAETTRLFASSISDADDATLTAPRPLSGDVGGSLDGPFSLSADGQVAVSSWRTPQRKGDQHYSVAIWDVASGERRVIDATECDYESPLVSPDGSLVAAICSTRPTPQRVSESWLVLIDATTGVDTPLARSWDRWGAPAAWSPDSKTLYVTADDDGDSPVFAVQVGQGANAGGLGIAQRDFSRQETADPRRLTGQGAFSSISVAPDGTLYALRSSYTDPGSIVRIDQSSGETTELKSPVTYPDLPGRLERIETEASDGARVPAYLLLPPDSSPEKPAPLALWIHGGPLGSWNAWSWRWCPWLLVSRGYAVVLPDPALSTGYGWDYIQRGWGRWGFEPFTDLMAVTDAVVARDDIDESRTVAMGGSFGGYMANWVAGQTDRFKAIVTHASLWNLETFGNTTDAPWFWANEMTPEMRAANSPHHQADKIVTPMLVVHGDKDYRVPIGEGLALWWALASGWDGEPDDLPHRFLYFPDENHWILTPNHARVWYETVLAFLARHVDGREIAGSELV